MILTLIVLVLVGVITFFHYVQGLFSASLSAMIAVIASVVAFSFHEPLVRMLGKFPDYAPAIAIVLVFVICYGLLRFLFDKFIPGNVQVPLIVDKVGAAVMGLVAAIFSVGIGIVAVQTLPFGPSIGGYGRYAMNDKGDMVMPNKEQGPVYNALKSDMIKDEDHSGLLIPVDDLVVNTVYHLSDGGALSADAPLKAAHPAYLDELFFQRLGVQAGAKHVAVNNDKDQQVSVQGLWSPLKLDTAADSEKSRPSKLTFQPTQPTDILLVVRVSFTPEAADTDSLVRIGPAGIRLAAGGKNFLPIGTIDQPPGKAARILLNKPDDFLVAPAGAPIDFVFQVPNADAVETAATKGAPLKLAKDVYIEAKRMAYVDLSGREILKATPPSLEKSVYRKYAGAAPLPTPTVESRPGGASPAAVAGESPFETIGGAQVLTTVFTPINVGGLNSDSQDVTFPGGTGTLRQKKFAKLQLAPDAAVVTSGDNVIKEFFAPDGRKIVQITAVTKGTGDERWQWADKLAQIELADTAGGVHKVNGAWGKVTTAEAEVRLVAMFDADAPITNLPRFENGPIDVGLIFVVPAGITLQELKLGGKAISSLSLTVP